MYKLVAGRVIKKAFLLGKSTVGSPNFDNSQVKKFVYQEKTVLETKPEFNKAYKVFKMSFNLKQRLPYSAIDKILQIKPVTSNKFVTVYPDVVPPAGKAGFGGMLLGQSILASLSTVSKNFIPVSSYSYFLVGCDPFEPIEYSVNNLRQGKNYIHQEIVGVQNKTTIFKTMVMLGKKSCDEKMESNSRGQESVSLNDFNDYVPANELFAKNLAELQKVNVKFSDTFIVDQFMERFGSGCIDYRFPKTFFGTGSFKKVLDYYIRILPDVASDYTLLCRNQEVHNSGNIRLIDKTDPRYNYALFSYLSDSYFLLTVPHFHGKKIYSHSFNTSLDHCIHWHTFDLNCNNWMNFQIRNPSSFIGNRHLVTGEIFDATTGFKVASCVQEGISTF